MDDNQPVDEQKTIPTPTSPSTTRRSTSPAKNMALRAAEWNKLPVTLAELCLDTTLRCGQSFRWRKSAQDEWSCALHGRILSVRQDASHLYYRAMYNNNNHDNNNMNNSNNNNNNNNNHNDANNNNTTTTTLVNHYFNLTPNLSLLYAQWAASDPNFKKRAPNFTGIRILRQDAWEALIAFICSSNNNIARISSMVHNLCLHYGPLIGHMDGIPYHDFPTPEALSAPNVETHLQKLGFGYRAKYVAKTARIVSQDKTMAWLQDLSNPENPPFGKTPQPGGQLIQGGREGYRKAHTQLLALHGVGPKVADCVCLFGLGWSESVPVDTHVWQIAQRDYKFGRGKHSSLTAATYVAVGDHFRNLWGKEAGWAHSVLFTAHLKTFSERALIKTEIKEEGEEGEVMVKKEKDDVVVKKEEDDIVIKKEKDNVVVKKEKDHVVVQVQEKKVTAKRKRVNKGPDEGEKQLVQVKEEAVRKSKRRQRI